MSSFSQYDLPYTTPDEDPFNVTPLLPHPRRRRSSLLDKWIKDQQIAPSSSTLPILRASSSPPNPYLAYPDLPLHALSLVDDTATVHSYDLVDDQDIPEEEDVSPQPPLTPKPVPSRTRPQAKHRLSPTSFRSFSISFRSSLAVSPPSPKKSPSRRISRISIFTRSPRLSTSTLASSSSFNSPITAHTPQHTRSSSLPATDIGQPQSSRSKSYLAGAGSPSKWRPTVLGHFSQLPSSSTDPPSASTFFTPSRPSVSSADTSNTHQSFAPTSSSTPESQPPVTPTKPSFIESLRFKSLSQSTMFKSHPAADSSSSLFSQANIPERISTSNTSCSSLSHHGTVSSRIPFSSNLGPYTNNLEDLDDEEDDVDDLPNDVRNNGTIKSGRPSAFSAGATLSRAAFSSLGARRHNKKKRKLVVSGVGVKEIRKLDGVKCWCESFGEVKQITRMPNGDLHVDFRSADVADTVCRLKAGVYISGVGRVQLSWYTGDKR